MEPPNKKTKIENDISKAIDNYIDKINQCTNLQPVLDESFYRELPLGKVYVGHVKNSKELSNIIKVLNERVPLKNLNHLKRVRNKEVLLCPTHDLKDTSIQDFINKNVPELKLSFEYFRELEVPIMAPKVKAQVNSMIWSYNFHPNNYNEKLVNNKFFSKEEMAINKIYMKMVFEIARWNLRDSDRPGEFLKEVNASIVVDPKIYSVVAASFCNDKHPLQHSAMLAIDNVAKTQNGGAWGESSKDSVNCTLSGIDLELYKHLRKEFLNMRFGSRVYKCKSEGGSSSETGPYLCTGYNVYMLKEPCVMCAMALVHARAKKVFFCFDNLKNGALKSKVKLQNITSLNHHFDVFTGYLK